MSENDLEFRKIPRLRGGWNVGPDEYKKMGYMPGFPPGFIPPNTKEIREISALMEAGGIVGEYPETTDEENEIGKAVYIYGQEDEKNFQNIANFLVTCLATRGIYSSPGITPTINILPGRQKVFAVIFPTEKDAQNLMSISHEITYLGKQLDIRTLVKYEERPVQPAFLFDEHPTRVLVTNVDTSRIDEFPSFADSIFGINAF